MIELDRALVQAFDQVGSIQQLGSTGTFRSLAPQAQAPPYIIFQTQATRDEHMHRAPDQGEPAVFTSHRFVIYTVRVVDRSPSAVRAWAIFEQAQMVLLSGALSVAGWTVESVHRWGSDIDRIEVHEGVVYQHVGGMFRFMLVPAP